MAIDLLGLVRAALSGPGAIDELSGSLGESAVATRSEFEAGLPAMLAAMIGKATPAAGASSLLSLFRTGSFDGSMLGDVARHMEPVERSRGA
ncbi:MAG: DUF937 domain-containing protein [Terriglobales bacterium]|jgi:hypothetical protein